MIGSTFFVSIGEPKAANVRVSRSFVVRTHVSISNNVHLGFGISFVPRESCG